MRPRQTHQRGVNYFQLTLAREEAEKVKYRLGNAIRTAKDIKEATAPTVEKVKEVSTPAVEKTVEKAKEYSAVAYKEGKKITKKLVDKLQGKLKEEDKD